MTQTPNESLEPPRRRQRLEYEETELHQLREV